MTVKENLANVRERMEAAAEGACRPVEGIRLIAVSKTKAAEDVLACLQAGHLLFGENYPQEMLAKQRELAKQSPDMVVKAQWHFIGHLQKNKINALLGHCDMIQSIDSIELASALHDRTPDPLSVLIEVNIANELNKGGFYPEKIVPIIKEMQRFDKIQIKGLMCVPPFHENPENSRIHFQWMHKLLFEINKEGIAPLSELSMGMSHDFEVAIEEGATIIRIGSAIFGHRPQKK